MKISITPTGITESIVNDVDSGKDNLRKASYHYFYCPSSFVHYSYVKELRSKINKYNRELNYIYNSLVKAERRYNSLFEQKSRKIDRINERTVDSRLGVQDVL